MLAFIDVSGDPYSDPKHSPWITIHTTCIRKRSIYDITAQLHRLKRDIPVPIFADSETTAGLQLADISAGIIRNYYANNLHTKSVTSSEDTYHRKLAEYFNLIKNRSVNRRISDFSVTGIYFPSADYRI